MKRTERVRLYPTPRQAATLERMLNVTRSLYNAALQQRKEAWRDRRLAISAKQQRHELTELRAVEPRFASVYQECEAAVIRRLDLAFAAFFARLKNGEAPGFPRFKGRNRFDTLKFPHGDRALVFDADQRRVRVPGVGPVKLRKGRAVPTHGQASITRRACRWYACFEYEREVVELRATGNVVGVDAGIAVFAALSDGTTIANPRLMAKHAATVARAQRRVARRKKRGWWSPKRKKLGDGSFLWMQGTRRKSVLRVGTSRRTVDGRRRSSRASAAASRQTQTIMRRAISKEGPSCGLSGAALHWQTAMIDAMRYRRGGPGSRYRT